jgi:hypothetical protein
MIKIGVINQKCNTSSTVFPVFCTKTVKYSWKICKKPGKIARFSEDGAWLTLFNGRTTLIFKKPHLRHQIPKGGK